MKVYKGNITRLPVDCIVNAANEHLGHGAGVAAAISRAAGPDFQQESDHKVQMHGRVSVTRCTKTSAGSLNYKCVIHAVGPRFSQYTSSTHDAYDLKSTIINALKMAEEEGITSVALPSISAGRKNYIYFELVVSCTIKMHVPHNGETLFFGDLYLVRFQPDCSTT